MRYLISGSGGFIGSNLFDKLKSLGHEVVGFDNFQTGKVYEKDSGFTEVAVSKEGFDGIFHLGMPSTSPLYKDSPIENVTAMVKVSMMMLELARKNKCPIVFASSSSLYNDMNPPHSEHIIPKIKDYYTEQRYWLERMGRFYSERFDLGIVALRFFSVYGPRDENKGSYANVITQFAIDMINGKSPLIYGDGKQSRDFVHVYDVAEACVLAMDYATKKKSFEIFNVGTGKGFTFNQSVDIINETLKTKIEPKYTENQIHNYVFDTLASTIKAENILGFKAKIQFEEGLKNHVKYLKGLK